MYFDNPEERKFHETHRGIIEKIDNCRELTNDEISFYLSFGYGRLLHIREEKEGLTDLFWLLKQRAANVARIMKTEEFEFLSLCFSVAFDLADQM